MQPSRARHSSPATNPSRIPCEASAGESSKVTRTAPSSETTRVFAGEPDYAEAWKARFSKAARILGEGAFSILPLSSQEAAVPAAVREDPVEHARRSIEALASLIASYCEGLTIFVDDLQWADAASLRFYARLLQNRPPVESRRYRLSLGGDRAEESRSRSCFPGFFRATARLSSFRP